MCNFINNANDSYLLYWWHRLDAEYFIQSTLCVLDNFQRSDAKEFSLVSNNHASPTKSVNNKKKDKNIKEEMIKNMTIVGDGFKALSYVAIQSEVEAWEDVCYRLEDTFMDLED